MAVIVITAHALGLPKKNKKNTDTDRTNKSDLLAALKVAGFRTYGEFLEL